MRNDDSLDSGSFGPGLALCLGFAGTLPLVLAGALMLGGAASCSAGGGSQLSGDASSGDAASGAGGNLGLTTSVGSAAGGGGPGPGGGGVPQTCEQALANQSYIGCVYWPTVTSNAGLYSGFEFAIAAANPTGSDAVVTVTRGAAVQAEVTVAAGQLQVIKLPWVQELKQLDSIGNGSGLQSVIATGGAYKVTSTVPITLYQFNPLEFQLPTTPADCPQAATAGGCFSFSNDASLLLPESALRDEYYMMGYPTFHLGREDIFGSSSWNSGPGFAAITATADGTVVDVTASAHVRPGPGVAALTPGGTGQYMLNAGDVLLLESGVMPAAQSPEPGKPCEQQSNGLTTFIKCPSPKDYDLTGTHIKASKPVSVIGGHDCTFIPYNRFACDHIEESIFPVEALGTELVVSAPQAVSTIGSGTSTPDNMYVRVLSATNGNVIRFDPPVAAETTLDAGQWIEIGPVAQDFQVSADNKILVGQFMVGENFSGESAGAGDPAQSVGIPTEQYRLSYGFYAPTSYTHNFVNVVAPQGATVDIDGTPVPASSFTPIGSTGLTVARHKIAGGAHFMTGSANFGIVVYGYGSYTSYMYPGGLNLETIVVQPK